MVEETKALKDTFDFPSFPFLVVIIIIPFAPRVP